MRGHESWVEVETEQAVEGCHVWVGLRFCALTLLGLVAESSGKGVPLATRGKAGQEVPSASKQGNADPWRLTPGDCHNQQ